MAVSDASASASRDSAPSARASATRRAVSCCRAHRVSPPAPTSTINTTSHGTKRRHGLGSAPNTRMPQRNERAPPNASKHMQPVLYKNYLTYWSGGCTVRRMRRSLCVHQCGSGGCRPPPPVAAPLASSLRASSRGDPPLRGHAVSWLPLERFFLAACLVIPSPP